MPKSFPLKPLLYTLLILLGLYLLVWPSVQNAIIKTDAVKTRATVHWANYDYSRAGNYKIRGSRAFHGTVNIAYSYMAGGQVYTVEADYPYDDILAIVAEDSSHAHGPLTLGLGNLKSLPVTFYKRYPRWHVLR